MTAQQLINFSTLVMVVVILIDLHLVRARLTKLENKDKVK